MKKHFISTVILFSCITLLHAQTKLSVKTGFNYSTARAYTGQLKQSTGFMPGANLGIQLNTVFEGLLHFTPSVSYQNRGFVINNKSNNSKTSNFIHYVDLAPLLSIFVKTGKKHSLSISAGPVASLAIAGTEKTTINGSSSTQKMKFSTTNNYGLFDFSLLAGAGFHLKKWYLEANYYHGLANINNNVSRDFRNIRNRTINISLGYYLKLYD